MGIEIHDAPGASATGITAFPYALLADFILRVIVRPKSGRDEAAEFRYQVYFELPNDPYPAGMRAANFVPRTAPYNEQLSFAEITRRFQAAQQQQGAPPPRPARRVAATTDDMYVKVRKNYNDMT